MLDDCVSKPLSHGNGSGFLMRQLVNWSVYAEDVAQFPDRWNGVARYVADKQLDGIELLIGRDAPDADIPRELVRGVHLPLWLSWLDIWHDLPGATERYFPQADSGWIEWCGGGHTSAELVSTLTTFWQHAAALAPDYMVWHVSHCEPAHAFTHAFTYSDEDVVDAVAAVLNTTTRRFSNNEPPAKVALENTWWPGLTFTSPAPALRLAERLAFDNWCFVLDTAHLMNTNHALRDEDEAVDFVLAALHAQDAETIARIEVMHLNLSLSGAYQKAVLARGLPATFSQLPYSEIFNMTQPMIFEIDQHRPISSSRWHELIDYVNPRSITHEFTRRSLDDLNNKLQIQQQSLVRTR